MGNVPQLNTDETLRVPRRVVNEIGQSNGWLRSVVSALPAASRLVPAAYSIADQALAVGATFLANVMLARTQSKEEYGMFALSTRSSRFWLACIIPPSSSLAPFTAPEGIAAAFPNTCG